MSNNQPENSNLEPELAQKGADASEEAVTTAESVNDAESSAVVDEKMPDVHQLMSKLEEAEKKAAESLDAVLRERAEAQNIKRRAERDVSNARKFALERMCQDLLPVMDSLEQGLAVSSASDESKAMLEGMELTLKMLIDVMKKHGVEIIDPVGESFNPEHHEAMVMQESDEHEPNTIISVFQKGYVLNGRLVRAARVVVAKGSAPSVDTKA